MANLEKIILASNNAGKIRELTTLLQPFNMQVIPQSEFNTQDIEEPGLTFIENAIIKARYAAQISGLRALADDSGLAVDALNGAPGIHSARYAGDHLTPKENIAKLTAEMQNIPDNKRQATFHCVLALLNSADDPAPIVCHGRWHGMILREMSGEHGFGYDPIFYVPSEKKSAAELTSERKNQLSHRGTALRELLKILQENLDCHGRFAASQ